MIKTQAQEILDFWFGKPTESNFGEPKKAWFMKSAQFDQEIRDRFLALHQEAIAGAYDGWQYQPKSCLALLIVLDQFSRNLFRGTAQAFSADPKALAIAKYAIAQHYDDDLNPVECWFIYLPFEHSEDWADQQQSLKLWHRLSTHPPSASAIEYAARHADVIRQFGRFPHRNKILQRPSTPTESNFLQQPGSSF